MRRARGGVGGQATSSGRARDAARGPIDLLLDQNCKCDKPRYLQNDRTETIAYRIRGSIRLLLE